MKSHGYWALNPWKSWVLTTITFSITASRKEITAPWELQTI
jgi:hypothetical protein